MKTIVYIDGFNLYYGALRKTDFKWLDLSKLCAYLLTQHRIVRIKYFTARIKSRSYDPSQPSRQQAYLRALRTIPNLEIIYGQFLQSIVTMPLAGFKKGSPEFVRVNKTEEKGSDVNIAAHMVHDGHLGFYDAAVIISNDSDLVEPVKIVRHDLGKVVGMINPHKKPSYTLARNLDFVKQIRTGVLRLSQFPDGMRDESGSFAKPKTW